MDGMRTVFYLGSSDINAFAVAVESAGLVSFTAARLFDTAVAKTVEQLSSVAALGRAPSGNSIVEPRFLVVERGRAVRVRSVAQRTGGVKYAIDQLENPESVALRLGRVFENGVLITGELSTVSSSTGALSLCRWMNQILVEQTTSVRGIRVGTEAIQLMRARWRLTDDVRSPPEYDLRI